MDLWNKQHSLVLGKKKKKTYRDAAPLMATGFNEGGEWEKKTALKVCVKTKSLMFAIRGEQTTG